MRTGILLVMLLCARTVAAQPGSTTPTPSPAPVPAPQPYPYPYPYPYYYPPQPPPAPPKQDEPPAMPVATQVLFHGLCPTDTEPACGGGLWMGLRGTTLAGATDDTTVGLALDIGLGFSFGFGWEVNNDIPQEERDSMAFVTAIAEAAIGPGLRTSKVDILPAIGIGGEAVAWGTTDRDDDPYSEGYWYGVLAGHVRLPGYTLLVTATRKYANRHGLSDPYETGLEVGFAWSEPRKRAAIQITVWYQHFDTHTIGGLAFGVAPSSLVKR